MRTLPALGAIQRTNVIVACVATLALLAFRSPAAAISCLLGATVVIANLFLLAVLGRLLLAGAAGGAGGALGAIALPLKLVLIAGLVYVVLFRWGVDGVGFALGTYLGITIEQRLAFGLQVVSLFTRNGAELAKGLISAGYRVAEVRGHTRDGEVTILYVEIPRKQVPKLIHDAATIDEECFCVVNDVRVARYLKSAPNLKTSRA